MSDGLGDRYVVWGANGFDEVAKLVDKELGRLKGVETQGEDESAWDKAKDLINWQLETVKREHDQLPFPPKREEAVGEATKKDEGKVDLSLLPWPALKGIALALQFGKDKYGRDNYRRGFRVTRPLAAALRHIFAYLNGEDLDPESGLPHTYHALASLAMLVTNVEEGTATDDRYIPNKKATK